MLPRLGRTVYFPAYACLLLFALPVCSVRLQENDSHLLLNSFLLSICRFSRVPSVQECFLKEWTDTCLSLIQEFISISNSENSE